jgi:uncharacterized protein (TIGR02246 family)
MQMSRSPEHVIENFIAAVNAGDIERVLAVYEPGARLAFPGQPSVGHEAIRGALQNLLAQKPTMTGRTVSVSQMGDVALLRSEWSFTGIDQTGARVEMSGESAEVVRCQPDGTWLYIIDLPMGKE